MQRIRRRKFGEILVAEGLITREVLQDSLSRQQGSGMTVGALLLADGVITETDIVRCISSQYQLPFIRTSSYELDKGLLDAFGSDFLYRNRIVPLDRIGDCVVLAVSEIPEEDIEKAVMEKLGCDVYYYIASNTDVENTLRRYFKIGQEKMIALDEQRRAERAHSQLESTPAGPVITGVPDPTQNKLLQSLDQSWEVIFDEAENNVQSHEEQA